MQRSEARGIEPTRRGVRGEIRPSILGGGDALKVAIQLQPARGGLGQHNIHFGLGGLRRARTVRVARKLLLDVAERSHLSGRWLLNVPPCPDDT